MQEVKDLKLSKSQLYRQDKAGNIKQKKSSFFSKPEKQTLNMHHISHKKTNKKLYLNPVCVLESPRRVQR